MSRPLLLAIAAAAVVGASCSSDASPRPQQDATVAVTTTTAYNPPPSARRTDTSELPPLETAGRFDHSRARIAVIEGYTIDEARSWATDSGWTEIRLFDLDHPDNEEHNLAYDSRVIGLYHEGGIVVEAWTGG